MNGMAEAPERTTEKWYVLMTLISAGLQDLCASMYSFSGHSNQKSRREYILIANRGVTGITLSP